MGIQIWWIWLIIAAVFVVGEIFTAGFFLLWFGIGALLAGIAALAGLGPAWQWGIFVLVSLVLFLVSRRFAERFTKKQPPGIGADRFVGKRGIVLEEINNDQNVGRIRVEKDEWRADSETGEVIPAGTRIEVVRVQGAHAVVKTIEE
jgi:membrane protein implicated in regulation of membrane protease activity